MSQVKELVNEAIKILVAKIEAANEGYWERSGDSPYTDAEYDQLVEELRNLAPHHPLLEKIGDENDGIGAKVVHKKPMLSLAKAYSHEDIAAWVASVARGNDELFLVEPKYDGLSCEVCKGRLVTRGNGKIGSNCTHIFPYIDTVNSTPMSILIRSPEPVYGEIVILKETFKLLQEQFGAMGMYKTPRNMAAGLTNTKPEILKEFMNKVEEKLPKLRVFSFMPHNGNPSYMTSASKVTDKDNFDRWVSEIVSTCPSPIDGIVVKVGDMDYAASLGATAHHPNSAIAFKFKDEEFETIVRSIEWSVGNEAITPVVVFDTVDIDGVQVNRATAHNAQFIQDKHIVPGTQIKIVRRGDVIPKIVDVAVDTSKEVDVPTTCPSCGGILSWDGPDIVCTNDECPGRITNKICKGLKCLGILGIGPAWVEKIIHELGVPDIMCWMMEAWDTKFLRAKGYPEHIVRTIISEIERVSTQGVAEEDILASLCIPMVGKTFGRMVINTLGGIGYLTEPSSFEKLKSVPRINSTAIENVKKFMEKNAGDFMLYYQMFLHPGTVPKEHTEDWPKFCFTGALPKSRKDIGAELLAKGATLTENIREADFLVASNKLTQSSKMKYATKNNIPVISYEQIDKMIASIGK